MRDFPQYNSDGQGKSKSREMKALESLSQYPNKGNETFGKPIFRRGMEFLTVPKVAEDFKYLRDGLVSAGIRDLGIMVEALNLFYRYPEIFDNDSEVIGIISSILIRPMLELSGIIEQIESAAEGVDLNCLLLSLLALDCVRDMLNYPSFGSELFGLMSDTDKKMVEAYWNIRAARIALICKVADSLGIKVVRRGDTVEYWRA